MAYGSRRENSILCLHDGEDGEQNVLRVHLAVYIYVYSLCALCTLYMCTQASECICWVRWEAKARQSQRRRVSIARWRRL